MFQSWIVTKLTLKEFYLPLLIDLTIITFFTLLGRLVYKKDPNYFKAYIFFSIWFAIGLGLHMQIIAIDQTVSDRWLYFPIIGLLALLGVIAQTFELNLSSKKIFALTVILISILSVRSIYRNTNWKNNSTLYANDIQKNPDSAQLQAGYGYELFYKGLPEQAEQHFTRATEIFPSIVSYEALGTFYLYSHKPNDAEYSYNKALTYGDSPVLYSNLAILYINNRAADFTTNFVAKALEKYPEDSKLLSYEAFIKYQAGDKKRALEIANQANSISHDPEIQNLIHLMETNQKFKLVY